VIELRTLGALELLSARDTALDAVLSQPKRTALLCYLALASPQGFRRRDTLLALFWPEHDAEHARHALRQSLYFLRRALGPGAVESRGDDELAISPLHVRCDAAEFVRAVDERRLGDALALYRGELLPGFHLSDAPDFERWLDVERTRLRLRAVEASWAFAESHERDGDAHAAAEWAQRAVALSPGEESGLRRLVVQLNRMGDRSAAVRAYDAFARDLEREYELTPSDETRALLTSIRAQAIVRQSTVPRERHAAPSAPVERSAAPETSPDVAARSEAEPARLLAVPRWRWRAPGVLATAAATSGLLAIAAWQLTNSARAAPVHPGRQRVIITDFTNLTRDSTLGDLAAQVLRSELARSPLLRVVGPGTIQEVLRRMRQSPDARVTAVLARELAARERINVVVEGDVRPAGAGIVISASVIETATGDALYGATETARDSTDLLAAIERVSDDVRRGIGESLASIHASDSLYQFTTSSLPALRKHMAATRAMGRGDYAAAAELLQEAIALDPGFAHAYLLLEAVLTNSDLPKGRTLYPLMRAYELRDRLTDRERYAIEAEYNLDVTGDVPRALAAFEKHVETLRQLPPGEPGWYGSYGETLALTGDLVGAERVLQEGRRRFPTVINQMVLVEVLYALGRDAEVHRTLEDVASRSPTHPLVLAARAGLLADSGRYDEAHALAAQIRRDGGMLNGLVLEAELDGARGAVREALGHLRELRDDMLARHDVASATEVAVAIGRLRLIGGDSGATSEVDVLLAAHPMDSVDTLSRPYLPLASFYADAGRPARARAWLAAYEREFPPALVGPDQWRLHRARGAALRAEGKYAEALGELLLVARTPALRAGLFDDTSVPATDSPELARAYDAAGIGDSAIVVYERYLAVRSLRRVATDAFELGSARARLRALYAARGRHTRP
jgi:DNA-binding SARP family transcriptional activator/TolB-like protein